MRRVGRACVNESDAPDLIGDHMIRVLERGPGVDQMLDRPQI